MSAATLGTSTASPRGWASVNDRPEDFPGVQHVWKRRRLSAGLKAATVIRRMSELAAREGIQIAAPHSLKTMLSKWENGKQAVPAAYEHLLCLIYGIRRPQDVARRPARYRNNAIYDRQLQASAWAAPLLQPGLR
jgi:hypothetical protein